MILLNPGPVNLSDRVRKALLNQDRVTVKENFPNSRPEFANNIVFRLRRPKLKPR